MKDCRLFRIEGRVQGVWFRESTRQQALSLGITGYARNLPGGAVEVLACGETASLERLAAWLHEGPQWARVTKVQSKDTHQSCPGEFTAG